MRWLRCPPEHRGGLGVPWAYVRRHIAARWHVPPWAVDDAPAAEVALELRLSELEAANRPPEPRR